MVRRPKLRTEYETRWVRTSDGRPEPEEPSPVAAELEGPAPVAVELGVAIVPGGG